ncbi:MAG: cytochrome d ubiquinol oxidase subunit II [Nitrospira sp.]|nr:MAG: cytochrome d ubiquinol oxidase subunit II [Nitrospira sp.]
MTLMLAVYVVLDGFDFGLGIIYRFVARTEADRRAALASIGPVWNGNEVWLIAAGGLLFFAFPKAYAAGFSGFYLALIIVLWLLIVRGLALELRSHLAHVLWRQFWDAAFAGASTLLAIVLGATPHIPFCAAITRAPENEVIALSLVAQRILKAGWCSRSVISSS